MKKIKPVNTLLTLTLGAFFTTSFLAVLNHRAKESIDKELLVHHEEFNHQTPPWVKNVLTANIVPASLEDHNHRNIKAEHADLKYD
jgi:hypothetical protein